VSGLNDKLSSSDASFAKSKYKGNNRKKDIKSLTKSLDNLHAEVACLSADLNRATVLEAENGVQGELFSLATSAGFKYGLSMNQTENEFAAVLKKMTHFVPGAQAHSTNVPTSRDACVSPPILKESIVIPSSGTLELSANIVPAPSAIALEQNEEWVSVMVDGPDAEMTDVGSECVSFGPADVVVALSIGEKVNGSLPSSVAEEKATANLFGWILSHATHLKPNGFPFGTFRIAAQAFIDVTCFLHDVVVHQSCLPGRRGTLCLLLWTLAKVFMFNLSFPHVFHLYRNFFTTDPSGSFLWMYEMSYVRTSAAYFSNRPSLPESFSVSSIGPSITTLTLCFLKIGLRDLVV
nr:hypothetical protein [Tanacetum cinerariifolium]